MMTQITSVGIEGFDKWAQAFQSSAQTCIRFRKILLKQQKEERSEQWASCLFGITTSQFCEWWRLVSNLHNYPINIADSASLHSVMMPHRPPQYHLHRPLIEYHNTGKANDGIKWIGHAEWVALVLHKDLCMMISCLPMLPHAWLCWRAAPSLNSCSVSDNTFGCFLWGW